MPVPTSYFIIAQTVDFCKDTEFTDAKKKKTDISEAMDHSGTEDIKWHDADGTRGENRKVKASSIRL